jgi:hypothetical protein
VSEVVASVSRYGPAPGGFVTDGNVSRSCAPAATARSVNSRHSTSRPTGAEQAPTSAPAVASSTSPPSQPANAAPAGNVTTMRLLASSARAPVADAVARTT